MEVGEATTGDDFEEEDTGSQETGTEDSGDSDRKKEDECVGAQRTVRRRI